ncbi:exonuclease subunit SbcD [Arcanobacterium hippocoleae]
MKIIHTSDWHLGRKFYENDLSESFARWGDFLVDLARESQADAVLISGDVYDRGIPALQMIELLEDILARLLDFTQVLITSGNHDSARRLGFAAQFLRDGLYIQTDSLRSGQPIALKNMQGEIGAIVYGIPYLDPDTERARLAAGEELLARSHSAVIQRACALIREDISGGKYSALQVPRIAMAHAFVSGSEKSESELDLSIGGIDSVPAKLFRLGKKNSAR